MFATTELATYWQYSQLQNWQPIGNIRNFRIGNILQYFQLQNWYYSQLQMYYSIIATTE